METDRERPRFQLPQHLQCAQRPVSSYRDTRNVSGTPFPATATPATCPAPHFQLLQQLQLVRCPTSSYRDTHSLSGAPLPATATPIMCPAPHSSYRNNCSLSGALLPATVTPTACLAPHFQLPQHPKLVRRPTSSYRNTYNVSGAPSASYRDSSSLSGAPSASYRNTYCVSGTNRLPPLPRLCLTPRFLCCSMLLQGSCLILLQDPCSIHTT